MAAKPRYREWLSQLRDDLDFQNWFERRIHADADWKGYHGSFSVHYPTGWTYLPLQYDAPSSTQWHNIYSKIS